MFFILSKVLDFLLSPIVWIIGLFLISFIIKNPRYKSRMFYTAFGMLVLLSNPFIAEQAFRAWEGDPVPMSSVGNYDVGIVLTGVAFSRGEAPDRMFFSKGADRVLHAIQLYKAGKIKKILISGGASSIIRNNIPEAGRLREVMLYSGVPDSVIIVEDKSRNTRENALFTKRLSDRLDLGSRSLLITSAFHMPRSLGCFSKVGMKVDPYKTDFYVSDSYISIDKFIPDEHSLFKWDVLIHEGMGWVVYKMVGYQ